MKKPGKPAIKILEGQILRVDLRDGTHAYARGLKRPLVAFYDRQYRGPADPSIEEIVALPIAFKVWVMDYAIKKSVWPIIGLIPLESKLKEVPCFFKQDSISGALAIYRAVPELAPHY